MSKEYIDREEVIKILEQYDLSSGSTLGCHSGAIECAISEIEMLPAADVAEVRHGRWRWVAYDANPKIGNWHCTYCNRIPKSFQKEDFCPNCGAKMDLQEEYND